jgi:hypothetical protein
LFKEEARRLQVAAGTILVALGLNVATAGPQPPDLAVADRDHDDNLEAKPLIATLRIDGVAGRRSSRAGRTTVLA